MSRIAPAAILLVSLPASAVTLHAVEAPGRLLGLERERIGHAGPIVDHSRVSRIVQESCQGCHRARGTAPFALESYADVSARAPMTRFIIKSRRMPPRFAHAEPRGGEGAHPRHGGDAPQPSAGR